MKILYVITGLTLSGAETQLYNLVSRMKEKHKVKVINFYGGHYAERFKEKGISVKTIKISSKLNFLKALLGLKKEIERFKPDVVHSFLPHSNITAKIVKIISGYKFKLICSVRVKEKRFFLQNLGERLLDFNCDHITTNSKTTKKFLIGKIHYDPKKIKVIYNGIDFKKTKGKDLFPEKKKIMTIANFRKQKDYPTNVRTCEELSKKKKDIVFMYIGEGEMEKSIKKTAKKKGLDRFIKFLGFRKDAKELLKKADVFFLPTLYEGQSNALIEAMHHRCPIVSTDIPENKEIIEDGKEGLLVEVKSPEKMAEAIENILDDKKLRERLKRNAYKKSKIFDVDKMAESYEKIYASLKIK